jgi:hypothetical protein
MGFESFSGTTGAGAGAAAGASALVFSGDVCIGSTTPFSHELWFSLLPWAAFTPSFEVVVVSCSSVKRKAFKALRELEDMRKELSFPAMALSDSIQSRESSKWVRIHSRCQLGWILVSNEKSVRMGGKVSAYQLFVNAMVSYVLGPVVVQVGMDWSGKRKTRRVSD